MKFKRTLIMAVASLAALAAQAQVGTHGEVGGMPYGPQGTTAPKLPAWATSNPWSTSYNPLIGFQSTKTRAQVRAELDAGRRAMLAHEGLLRGGEGSQGGMSAGGE